MRTPAEDLIAKWRKRERHDQRSGRSAIEARTWKQAADELEALLTAAVPQPLSSPMLAEAQRARAERAEAALRAYGQHTFMCRSTMRRWEPTAEDLDRVEAERTHERRMAIWREIDAKFAEGVQCTCGFAAVLGSLRTEQVP